MDIGLKNSKQSTRYPLRNRKKNKKLKNRLNGNDTNNNRYSITIRHQSPAPNRIIMQSLRKNTNNKKETEEVNRSGNPRRLLVGGAKRVLSNHELNRDGAIKQRSSLGGVRGSKNKLRNIHKQISSVTINIFIIKRPISLLNVNNNNNRKSAEMSTRTEPPRFQAYKPYQPYGIRVRPEENKNQNYEKNRRNGIDRQRNHNTYYQRNEHLNEVEKSVSNSRESSSDITYIKPFVSRDTVEIGPDDWDKYDWIPLSKGLYLIEDKEMKKRYIHKENAREAACGVCRTLKKKRHRQKWELNMLICATHKCWIHWGCTGLSFEQLKRISEGSDSYHCEQW